MQQNEVRHECLKLALGLGFKLEGEKDLLDAVNKYHKIIDPESFFTYEKHQKRLGTPLKK